MPVAARELPVSDEFEGRNDAPRVALTRPGRIVVSGLEVGLGLLLALLLLAAPMADAGAAGALDKLGRGPKVGETIPHPLTAADQNGKTQSFKTLKGRRGLILLFNRSLDW